MNTSELELVYLTMQEAVEAFLTKMGSGKNSGFINFHHGDHREK
jgi:hypothetical protein